MRKYVGLLVLVSLFPQACQFFASPTVSVSSLSPAQSRPNILFIITDDQDIETLAYMPRLQALLVDRGTTFTNMFVTYPVCCPSHASILTGRYPHNTGILGNNPPLGGFVKFRDSGQESSTIGTWLQAAGYRTVRIGKYLVGYSDRSTYVPPGWDEWHAFFGGSTKFFNYSLNENGRVVQYGDAESDYVNDVLADKVVDFIKRAEAKDDQPFFIFFAPPAPHAESVANGPSRPAPRHEGRFAKRLAPRTPSFNEADVSDKPPVIQQRPLLSEKEIAEIDHEYRTRIEALLSVDEAIERIVQALSDHGELQNTYIFFTSDNGYHLGQHRLIRGKGNVYEEDIRVPMVVRGPGVPARAKVDHLVLK
jgi:arylsulfatase A-like enzyme